VIVRNILNDPRGGGARGAGGGARLDEQASVWSVSSAFVYIYNSLLRTTFG